MSKKDEFKNFVKEKPHLFDYVQKEEMTWQKFYEMWDILGPDDNIWKKYEPNEDIRVTNTTSFSDYRLKDFVSLFKNMNVEKVQSNISSIQKGIGFLQDFFLKENKSKPNITPNNPYIPRATNKIFED